MGHFKKEDSKEFWVKKHGDLYNLYQAALSEIASLRAELYALRASGGTCQCQSGGQPPQRTKNHDHGLNSQDEEKIDHPLYG